MGHSIKLDKKMGQTVNIVLNARCSQHNNCT